MKNRELLLPKAIMILGIVIAVILSLFVSIAKKPAISEYRFPFSITYEFGGKTETIQDEFICTYTGPGESIDPRDRFYDGVFARNNNDEAICGDYRIQAYEDGELVLFTNLCAGYMMGDPNYDDYYTDYYRFEPYIAFYVYDEYIEYEDEEILGPYNVKIIDWDYPEPIENTFVFSRITRLTPSNALFMAGVSLLTILACIIFVKKDSSLAFGATERLSIILNFAIGCVAFPFLLIACSLTDINGDGADLLSQITYCIPAITGFGLAASVCLRRKGFSKWALVVQFAGIVMMALVSIMDMLT